METVGIVIWVDAAQETALVFCADGGDIAVVPDMSKALEGAVMPQKGDLVGLTYYGKNDLRGCERIWTIAPDERPGLADEIRQMAKDAAIFQKRSA